MLEVRYYFADGGESPFADWFAELDAAARAKITVAIARMGQGNLSNVKSVGGACLNTRSISGRATVSILGATAMR